MRIGWFSFALMFCFSGFAQVRSGKSNEPPSHEFAINYFYGSVLEHNPDMAHLITKHPSGLIFSYNKKTYGKHKWEVHNNYPDQGLSFIYQDMGNPIMGENYSLLAHFNFYFLHRHLMLKIGEGLTYNTHPYDRQTNYKNNVFGSHLLAGTVFMGNFVKKNIWHGLGLQAGFIFTHYSNGSAKAPNLGANTFAWNLGLTYLLNPTKTPTYATLEADTTSYAEAIHYNFVFRTGFNSSKVVGMGQYPFLTLSAFADKRISYHSTFQLGTEVFFSEMMHELIKFRALAFPEEGVSGNESATRIGLFGGYSFKVNKFSLFANLGYYLYYPYDFDGRIYNRIGVQRKLSPHFFVGLSLHSHWARAESVSLSFGYRL